MTGWATKAKKVWHTTCSSSLNRAQAQKERKKMTTLPPLQVLADPEWAGRHPCHDSRFITTDDGVFEVPPDGAEIYEFTGAQIVAAMRDCQHQAEYAKLFAAAPELYAALCETVQLLDANAIALALVAAPDGKPPTENHHPICARARAAIAKASPPVSLCDQIRADRAAKGLHALLPGYGDQM